MSENREIARIESTFLGIEDHGIMTFMLNLTGAGRDKGWGQAFGTYMLDWNPRDIEGHADSGYTALILRGILEAVGVDTWEKLPGKLVYAIRPEGPYSFIRGIEGFDTGKVFMIDSVSTAPGRGRKYNGEEWER